MKEIPVFQYNGFEKKKWVNMFLCLQHSNNFQKLRREMKNNHSIVTTVYIYIQIKIFKHNPPRLRTLQISPLQKVVAKVH